MELKAPKKMNKTKIIAISKLLASLKAEKVVAFRHRKLDYADFIIIASGLSALHLKSLRKNVYYELRKKKILPFALTKETRENDNSWLLLDYGELIIHFFLPDSREYYKLEGFFKEAEVIYQSDEED